MMLIDEDAAERERVEKRKAEYKEFLALRLAMRPVDPDDDEEDEDDEPDPDEGDLTARVVGGMGTPKP